MACCLHQDELTAREVLMHVAPDHLGSNRVLRALEDERPRLYAGKISPVVREEGHPCKMLGDFGVRAAEAIGEFLTEFRAVWIAHDHRSHCARPAQMIAVEDVQQAVDVFLLEPAD